MPEADEFDLWRESAVTRWFLQSLMLRAESVRANFIAYAFDGGGVDPHTLAFWRGQHQGLMEANEITYEELVEANQ